MHGESGKGRRLANGPRFTDTLFFTATPVVATSPPLPEHALDLIDARIDLNRPVGVRRWRLGLLVIGEDGAGIFQHVSREHRHDTLVASDHSARAKLFDAGHARGARGLAT